MSQITRKLSILSRCQAMYRANRLQQSDLLPPHYNYVIPICRNPGLSQEQLAEMKLIYLQGTYIECIQNM